MTVPSKHSAPASPPWRVDVVMPVFNEGEWPRRAIDAVTRSAARAAAEVRIVVVDDGSTDPSSVDVLDALAGKGGVVVQRQENRGRFAARAAGLDAADAPFVLLLDARVEIDEDALGQIRSRVERGGPSVWNFDVTPGRQGLAAAFWSGITKVWWRDYFRNRREVTFGAQDFDRYPKGTTAFFAPTAVLRAAMGGFDSWYDDVAVASDDTRLLRQVASAQGIALSPEITCRHHNKVGTRAWVRQCYYRGTTFVDGYLQDPGQARPLLLGGAAASLVAAGVVFAAPRTSAIAAVTGCGAAGLITRRSGGTVDESAAVALLFVPFIALFGAGVARGLRMVHDVA